MASEAHKMREVRRYLVRGRVQGVGFRWWTRREAERLQVGGWVRNREDGTVEVMARSDRETLGLFEEALRRGPPMARVEEVEWWEGEEEEGGWTGFEIRR